MGRFDLIRPAFATVIRHLEVARGTWPEVGILVGSMYFGGGERRSGMNVRRIFILGSALTLGVCAVLGAVAMHERDGSSSRRCVAAVGAEGQLCVTAVRSQQYRVTGSFLAP